jgi:predicted dehydrogenase
MLRISIVGCGKIADQHVAAINRIPGANIVSLCDRELLMARQLGERFRIKECFADLGDLLKVTSPDVVHITTPPDSHFPLARQCLEAGSHVYLEKPFTVTADQADALIELAERRGLKVTAGHNYQFTPDMLEMRRLVKKGFLGGHPVHLESYWSYDLGDVNYVGPVLGSRNHWVRRLPGQLLHNLISHGLARFAEFLRDDLAEVVASAHQSTQLAQLGGQEVLDELRVLIRDCAGTTAFFSFSTQIKPALNHFRICGPRNSLLAEMLTGSTIRIKNVPSKSYLTFFVPPLHRAREYFRNARINLTNVLVGRLHQDFGMKELIERFYQSIRDRSAPPLPYREILLTARIMDEVFTQIYPVNGAQLADGGGLKADERGRETVDRGPKKTESGTRRGEAAVSKL